VLYGVYVVLNKPELTPPADATAWEQQTAAPPDVQLGSVDSKGASAAPGADQNVLPSDKPQTPKGLVTDISDSSPASRLQSPVAETGGPPPSTLAPRDAGPLKEPQAQLASANVPAPAVTSTGPQEEPTAADSSRTTSRRGSPHPPANSLRVRDEPEFTSLRTFENAWSSAVAQLQKQQYAEALLTLSLFYSDAELTGEERQRLLDLIDPLAGKVIYSSEHALEAPYEVRPGDTLENIAAQYRVPAGLLQNINGIASPDALRPGTLLKVVRGPFRAEVDLSKSELVLFLGKYYAGRFPISIGNDPAPRPGQCEIQSQTAGREYQSSSGARIPARAPDNPYGTTWLDLGGNMAIHGSPESIPTQAGLGCISLSAADAADVAGILALGSKVLIR
jgi:lipoprotein-anchoring transpeptidase ErfK/SrfK